MKKIFLFLLHSCIYFSLIQLFIHTTSLNILFLYLCSLFCNKLFTINPSYPRYILPFDANNSSKWHYYTLSLSLFFYLLWVCEHVLFFMYCVLAWCVFYHVVPEIFWRDAFNANSIGKCCFSLNFKYLPSIFAKIGILIKVKLFSEVKTKKKSLYYNYFLCKVTFCMFLYVKEVICVMKTLKFVALNHYKTIFLFI